MEETAPDMEGSPRIEKLTLNSNNVTGLENFVMDENVTVTLNLKVLRPMGRQVWDEKDLKKPPEGEYQVLSGTASGSDKKEKDTLDKIDSAGSIDDLDKAMQEEGE